MRRGILLFIVFSCFSLILNATNYYVSNQGNDNNDGLSPSSTWKSIGKVNQEMYRFKAGDIIAFKGGEVFFGNLVVKGTNGSNANPITFSSYGSGKATISGEKPMTSWMNEGGNIWSSIINDEVYQAFKDTKALTNARIPQVTSSENPKLNYLHVSSVVNNKIKFTCSELIGLGDLVGATVHIMSYDWILDSRKITAFNSSSGQVTLNSNVTGSISNGTHFFINNHISILKSDNQWVFKNKKVFIKSGTKPLGISVSTINNHGIFLNSQYINIENLVVKGFNKNGIYGDGWKYGTINNCEILYCNETGIFSHNGNGGENEITNNFIKGCNFNGIKTYDSKKIINNRIEDIGLLKNLTNKGLSDANGIMAYGVSEVQIVGNIILNVGYSGIIFNKDKSLVKNNTIEKFCLSIHDGAGIYTWNANYSDVGSAFSKVEENIIIGLDNSGTWLSHGIYMDDRTHDVSISNNSISTTNLGIFLHNTKRMSVAYNNIYKTAQSNLFLYEDGYGGEGQMVGNDISYNSTFSESKDINNPNLKVKTGYTSVKNFSKYDHNSYFNSNNLKSIVSVFNGKVNYNTLKTWQEESNQDSNSFTNSTVWNSDEKSQFIINKTGSLKTFSLNGSWTDLQGNNYKGTISINPFQSRILIQTDSFVGSIEASAGPDASICKGENVVLTASGGTSYLWDTGAISKSITVSPIVITTYTVTVSDGSSTDSDDVIVTVNTVTANAGADVSIDSGDTITLIASGGDTYVWSTGETTASISVSPTATTDYTVTAKKGLCEDTDLVKVTVNNATPQPLIANAGKDVSICNGESTILTASGGTTYSWSNGETTRSITVNPNVTTTYTVTVSDGINTATDDVIVTVNDVTANAGVDVSVDSGDTITLTASGGDTYVWSTGETTESISVSPTATIDYTVTVKKGLCKDTDLVKVTVNNIAPQPVIANAGKDVSICNGESTILTASGGITYSWSNGETTQSITVNPSVTTTYTVTVSDGTNTATDDVLVTVNNVTANAGSDVSIDSGNTITLTASGGDTYIWSTGETTASISVSPNATIDYTVTAKKGLCKDTDLVKVTLNNAAPQPVIANAGVDVEICNGESTILTASGGTTYSWSNGETTQSITVNPTATSNYIVTVSDGKSTATDDVLITVNNVTANAGTDVSIDSGDTIALIASGGDTYVWSTGETTASISVSPTATTDYTVTAKKGLCKDTDLVKVTVYNAAPQPVIANAGLDVSICNGETTILTASGGATYSWSNGEITQSITVNPDVTTSYTVTVSDGLTSATDDVLVAVNDLPVADAGSDETIYKGDDTTLTASGGDTYKWSTGATTKSIRISPGSTKTYTLTAYKKGCEATDKIKITVLETKITNPPPAVAYAGEDISICLGESVTLTASGGSSYAWDTGDTKININVNPTRTTTYRLSASRGGTTDMDEIIVTVENCNLNASLPEEEIDKSIAVYPNPTNGLLNINLSNINDDLNLILLDVQGRIIYLDKINSIQGNLTTQIDISKFSKGIYFVKLYNESENFTRKILLI